MAVWKHFSGPSWNTLSLGWSGGGATTINTSQDKHYWHTKRKHQTAFMSTENRARAGRKNFLLAIRISGFPTAKAARHPRRKMPPWRWCRSRAFQCRREDLTSHIAQVCHPIWALWAAKNILVSILGLLLPPFFLKGSKMWQRSLKESNIYAPPSGTASFFDEAAAASDSWHQDDSSHIGHEEKLEENLLKQSGESCNDMGILTSFKIRNDLFACWISASTFVWVPRFK